MNDALLVAWLDGETTAAERELVERAIANDAGVRAKADLLRAARSELRDLLADPDAPVVAARPRRQTLHWLAAAAALLVVVAIATSRGGVHDAATASNDLLELRVVPVRAEWPMFGGVRFRLEGRGKPSRFFGPSHVFPCRIMTRLPGEDDAAAAARLLPHPEKHGFVPLVLDAEITLPDGTSRRGPVARVNGAFGETWTPIDVELIDVVVAHPSIGPWLGVRSHENGWSEDRVWCFERAPSPELGATAGFVPEEPGAYTIRFTLRSFTPPDLRFPTFAEPLVVETKFSLTGEVGRWSAPADGLAARAMVSSARPAAGTPFAIALQLRNDSARARAYNVAGVTMAAIPQPFHFDLVVDGQRWTQRDGLPVTFSGDSSFVPQPSGTMRSVIVSSDFWRHDGKRLSELAGRHSVTLRFRFQPTLWAGVPADLWQGEVETPPITIEVAGG